MKEETVEELLAKISETSKIKDKVHKELGIKNLKEKPEDMYAYSLKVPDLELISDYVIFHGKCYKKGMKAYKKFNLLPIQTAHYPHTDKSWCRVRCSYCKERLDEKAAIKFEKDREQRLRLEQEAYEDFVAEQIILGKM